MSLKLGYRDGGKTSEEGLSRLFSQLLERDGVINDDDLKVVAAGTPDNTVKVSVGDVSIGKTSPYSSTLPDYFYHAWAAAQESLTVGANSSGNPRIDTAVVYVDLSVVDSSANDNPAAAKVKLVAGTAAATPVAPTDAAIQTSVGASNPWVKLADVAVANGFTTITNANITDARPHADTPPRRNKILTLDFVAEGFVISQTTGLGIQITAGQAMVGGRIVYKPLILKTLTASKDTYIYLLKTAKPTSTDDFTYTEQANNAASPDPPADSILIGIVVTDGSGVVAGGINQGEPTKLLPIASSIPYAVTDSKGNLICPRDPLHQVLGYRQIVANVNPSGGFAPGLEVPFIAPANRNIWAETWGSALSTTSGSATALTMGINEGATQLGGEALTNAGANFGNPALAKTPLIRPSAGLHTYKTAIGGGGGTISLAANANAPAYIMIHLK